MAVGSLAAAADTIGMEPLTDTADTTDAPIAAEAADGLVSVVLRDDGRIASLSLDPKVKRLPVTELSAAIVAAVSTAQDEVLRRALARRDAEDRESAKRLSAELDRINDEYARNAAVYDAFGAEILKKMEG